MLNFYKPCLPLVAIKIIAESRFTVTFDKFIMTLIKYKICAGIFYSIKKKFKAMFDVDSSPNQQMVAFFFKSYSRSDETGSSIAVSRYRK